MNKADVMQAISETAELGAALSANDALDRIVDLVVGLDPEHPSFIQDMDALLGVGAHIWKLRQDMRRLIGA